MAQSSYLHRVQAINRNQQPNDVERGMQVGQQVGKLLGGLSEAIKGAQKDALANKLMNTVDAPRAGLVSSGGPQPGSSQGVDSGDPNADLSTDLPSDVSQTIGGSAPVLNQAVAAQRLSGSPGTVDPNADLSTDLPDIVSPTQSVQVPASPSLGINPDTPASTAYSGTGTDPTLASNVAAAQLSNAPVCPAQLNPPRRESVLLGPNPTGRGGRFKLELMKEMQADAASESECGDHSAVGSTEMGRRPK